MQPFLTLPWYGTYSVPLEVPAIDEGGPEEATSFGGEVVTTNDATATLGALAIHELPAQGLGP